MNEIKAPKFKTVGKSVEPRFADTYRGARRNIFFGRPSTGNKTQKFRTALAQANAVIAEETTDA